MLEISQREIERLFFDPVMAAKVLMNADLDVFQQARLRMMWFVPQTIDNSGVGAGKTEVVFIYLNLRCILIPNHWAAIYYPVFQIGKDEFWVKFADYLDRSEIYRAQFHEGTRAQDEIKANQRSPGAWIRSFKDGSRIVMPAPDFKKDSQNQASRTMNTVVIDDYLRAADQGDGIDKQLIDRARRHCFNKNHPIWCNHIKLLGHAESPTHKEYKRYSETVKEIREGSTRNAVFTFCYQDWTEKFAQKFREDSIIEDRRRKLPRDRFRRQYLGIWTLDGENFFPEAFFKLARKASVVPRINRRHPAEYFFLGQDTAQPGASRKADWSAWFTLLVTEHDARAKANFERAGRYFQVRAAHAYQRRNRDAGQLAAYTHKLHLRYQYSGICMDPRGGGLFVLPELRKTRQLIDNLDTGVIGLTDRKDTLQTTRIPIVSLFERGSDFDGIVDKWFMRGEEGFLEYWMDQLQECIYAGGIQWPALASERPRDGMAIWTREQQIAQGWLDVAQGQLMKIRQLKRPDGEKLTGKRGYGIFEVESGKKDLSRCVLYAFAAFIEWLDKPNYQLAASSEDCFGAYQ